MMKKILLGCEIERMPDSAFKIMKLFFKVYYFFKPAGRYIEKFGIKPGEAVVDYGCGPGAFIKSASHLVGEKGIVYAVDIHDLAITSVKNIVKKYHLKNVKPILAEKQTVGIENNAVDLIYAIDMFHMVKDTDSFLGELNRITKPDGQLIIEDGHQPRSLSKEKIIKSGCWEIIGEEKEFLRCTAKKKNKLQVKTNEDC
jgi:ubiquinone/menaquinone biosynthesis C-methylase UbiE